MVLTVNKPYVRRFITWIESADWNPCGCVVDLWCPLPTNRPCVLSLSLTAWTQNFNWPATNKPSSHPQHTLILMLWIWILMASSLKVLIILISLEEYHFVVDQCWYLYMKVVNLRKMFIEITLNLSTYPCTLWARFKQIPNDSA